MWVAPGTAYDETLAALDRAGAGVVHRALPRRLPRLRPAAVRVGEWWDLPSIAALYDEFLAEHRALTRLREPDPARAFAAYVPMLTAWRRLPYLDPGIPLDLLPGRLAGRAGGRPVRRPSTPGCASPRRSTPTH